MLKSQPKTLTITQYILSLFFLTLALGNANAQTGPGGVGNNSNNGLWLRADQLTLSNGDPVNIWTDNSGNGNNGLQGTFINQPTYLASSSLNGQPTVVFDGLQDKLIVNDDNILDGSVGLSYFSVVRPTNLDNSTARAIYGKRQGFSTNASSYAYTSFFWSGNNALNTDIVTGNNRFTSGAGQFSNNNNYIISTQYDGSLSATERVRVYNGTTLINTANESSNQLTNITDNLVIGSLNETDTRYLGMEMGEIIQYNIALNRAQTIIVQNYLSAKYNIPITGLNVYTNDDVSNGNFDYEVAGIGRVNSSNEHTDAKGSGMVRINSANDLDDNEFLLWGHDNQPAFGSEISDVPTDVQSRLTRVWRASEKDTLGGSVDVGAINIQFDLNGLGPVTPSDLRLLIDTDNDGDFNDEIPIAGASSTGGGNYSFSGVTAISDGLRFTLGSFNSTSTPLPVTWLNLEGKVNESNEVQLDWSTTDEIANNYFTIQRSHNLEFWNSLGDVAASEEASATHNYIFWDKNPLNGLNYYRIQQTDIDGTQSYSRIIAVEVENNNSTWVYPNPASETITIPSLESNYHIYNLQGKDVTELIIPVSQDKVNIQNLEAGSYLYKSLSGNHFKFIKY